MHFRTSFSSPIVWDKNGGSTDRGRCYHPSSYSTTVSQDCDIQLEQFCRYADRAVFPRSSFCWVALKPLPCVYYIIGSFPNAGHHLLCSLNGNSLINRYWSSVTHSVGGLTFSQHQVEDFLEAVREDQQQPGGSSELLSSLEKEAGPPTISVEENQRNDESDANRNPEPDGAGVAIEILRGGGGPAGGEKRGSSGSGGNGWWGGATRGFRPAWLVVATFVHEAWLFLQHANVLLNPLCQRLDRGYGIALVRFSNEFRTFLDLFEDCVAEFMGWRRVAWYSLVGWLDRRA